VAAPCDVARGSGIMTLNSPSGTRRNVACGSGNISHWIRQVAAPCNVICGSGMTYHWICQLAAPCNVIRESAIEFAQTSAILKFYFWFQFRSYHHSWHVILHQSTKFYTNRTAHSRKMRLCRFSRWRISTILDFRGSIMGSLKGHSGADWPIFFLVQ